MIPAISLLKFQIRCFSKIQARLLLFVGLAMIGAGLLAKISVASLSGWAFFLVMLGLVVFVNERKRVARQDLRLEREEPAFWQDQFSNGEDEPPLVLVADDDVFMRSALDFHLTRAGFRVEHAINGNEAVAKATKETAVVLLDLAMSGTDGFYCLRDVVRSAPTAKIIAITRKNHGYDTVLCRKLGAYDSLSKPLDPHEVVALVARAVNNEPIAHADLALSA